MKVRLVALHLIIALNLFQAVRAQNVRIRLENCELDPQTLVEIQNSLNFQLVFYERIFKTPVDSSFKARIFGSEKDFVKYSKSKANFNPTRSHSIAFFDYNLMEMILHKDVDDFASVFAHELSHAILHYYCKDASTWIHEGLAELMEDIVLVDSKYFFDVTQVVKIGSAQTLLREGASVSDAMKSSSAGTFYQSVSSWPNYTLSFAALLYLYNTRDEVLSGIIRGECDWKHDQFLLYYPGGLDLFEMDVKSYFLNHRPN